MPLLLLIIGGVGFVGVGLWLISEIRKKDFYSMAMGLGGFAAIGIFLVTMGQYQRMAEKAFWAYQVGSAFWIVVDRMDDAEARNELRTALKQTLNGDTKVSFTELQEFNSLMAKRWATNKEAKPLSPETRGGGPHAEPPSPSLDSGSTP